MSRYFLPVTATVFSSEITDGEERGVYALTYTPDGVLSAASITKENISVTCNGENVSVEDIYYYPEKNLMLINTEFVDCRYNESAYIRGMNIKKTDGSTADFSAEAALTAEFDAEYGRIAVSAVYYSQNGSYISNIRGKNGVLVTVRITNTTSEKKENAVVKVYDGEVLAATGYASIEKDDFTEVTIDTAEHVFSGNEITVSVE